jgi:hypothetical protein
VSRIKDDGEVYCLGKFEGSSKINEEFGCVNLTCKGDKARIISLRMRKTFEAQNGQIW